MTRWGTDGFPVVTPGHRVTGIVKVRGLKERRERITVLLHCVRIV